MTKWLGRVDFILVAWLPPAGERTDKQPPATQLPPANNLVSLRGGHRNFDSSARTAPHKRTGNLLFLHDILLDGSQGGVVALLESAGGQVPLVLIFQVGVLLAKVRHLVLQLIDPYPLLLQKPLLGLYDLIQLL